MATNPVSTSKISVWWDIENCPVPSGLQPHIIARNVSSVLQQANLRGPISISAYGDTKHLPPPIQLALTSTGIHLHHIPSGRKDASDKAILVDMIFWALDNPPPAHILLISGDRDFANALHRLRMKTYNILLAQPSHGLSPHLREAASSVWYWTDLAKGEAITTTLEKQGLEHFSSSLGYLGIPSASSTPSPRQQPEHALSPQLFGEHPSMSNQALQGTAREIGAHPLPNTSNPQDTLPSSDKIRQVPDTPNPVIPSYLSSQQQSQIRSNCLQEKLRPSLPGFPQSLPQDTGRSINGLTQTSHKRSDEHSLQNKGHSVQRISHEHLSAGVRSPELPVHHTHQFEQTIPSPLTRGIFKPPSPPRFGNLEHIRLPAPEGMGSVGPHRRNGHISTMQPNLHLRLNPALVSMAPLTRNGNVSTLQPDFSSRFYPVYVLTQLRKWLVMNVLLTENGQNGYDISQVRKDFELATGIRLESPQPLGYKGILDLFNENFSDIMIIKSPCKGLSLIYAKPTSHRAHPTSGSNNLERNGPAPSVSVPSGNEEISVKQLPKLLISDLPSKAQAPNNPPSQDQKPEKTSKSCSREDILKKLRAFFCDAVRKSGHGYDVSHIRKDFESMNGISLDLNGLGFKGIRNLVEHFKDIVQIVIPRPGLCVLYSANKKFSSATLKEEDPSNTMKSSSCSPKAAVTEYSRELLGKCRTLLCTFLQGKGEGCPQERLVEEFRKAFDCELDYKAAGYAKLDDLLDSLADVVQVENSVSGQCLLRLTKTPSPPIDSVALKVDGVEKGVLEEKQLHDVKNALGRRKDPALSMLFPLSKKGLATFSSGETCTELPVSAFSSSDNSAANYAGKLLMDCRVLLSDLFSFHTEGFPQVMLQEAFQQCYGYELDYKAAGFSNLENLVETLAEVVQVQIAAGGQRILWPTMSLSHSKEVGLHGSAKIGKGEKESVRTLLAVFEKEKKVWQKVNVLPANKPITGTSFEEDPGLPLATSISMSKITGIECYPAKLLTDCKTLLQRLLPRHPAGFHLAKLPQEFERAYGYLLDYKSAGYPKLNDLLDNYVDFVSVKALPHCVLYLKTVSPSNEKVTAVGVTKLPETESPSNEKVTAVGVTKLSETVSSSNEKVTAVGVTNIPELLRMATRDVMPVDILRSDSQGGLVMADLDTEDKDGVRVPARSSFSASSPLSKQLDPAVSGEAPQSGHIATAITRTGSMVEKCQFQLAVPPRVLEPNEQKNEQKSSHLGLLDMDFEAVLSRMEDQISKLQL